METLNETIEQLKTRYAFFRTGPDRDNEGLHMEILRKFFNAIRELKKNLNTDNEKTLEKLKDWLEAFGIFDLEKQFDNTEDGTT
jgi:hypothetical protein